MTESELTIAIQNKGNQIRELKEQKDEANKEKIQQLVTELLSLKAQYKTTFGKEYSAKPLVKKKEKPLSDSKVSESDKKVSKNQLKKDKKKALKAQKNTLKSDSKSESKSDSVPFLDQLPSNTDLLLRQAQFQAQIQQNEGINGQIVTPWEVESENGVDYDKLIHQFGCAKLDTDLLSRFEKITGHRPHRYLRRGFFFAHRDLNLILDAYEAGQPFYLYTGRGPSSGSLHMGHLIPFTFVSWLQNVFQVPLVIQLTDDEKYLFRDQTLEQSQDMMYENAKDIIACGFDVSKTFIFADTQYIQYLYPLVLQVQKHVTFNQARGIFGFNGSDNIGKIGFPAVQAVPSFSEVFPVPFKGRKALRCLIPAAIDQDPYFRMTRDVAARLGYPKPSTMYSKFFPALQGSMTKMSASKMNTTIFMSDSAAEIADKIKKFAFSGGGETLADHKKYGADLDKDIPFQYLSFMLEDDEELEMIKTEYKSGRMMSGQVKERLIQIMTEFANELQTKRAQITQENVLEYMRIRPLDF